MKKRRALLTLLALLLVVGIPTGFLVREFRQEQASRDLIIAIKADDTERALAALQVGADPNARDHSEDESLSFSDRIERLLNKALHRNVNPETNNGLTALLLHLESEKEDNPLLVKALLDPGADPSATGSSRRDSPLTCAANNRHFQSLCLLIGHGAQINPRDRFGYTPVRAAFLNKDKKALQILLDKGANINLTPRQLPPPLHQACYEGDLSTVKLLLRYHANVNLRDADKRTLLDRAGEFAGEKVNDVNAIKQMLRQAGGKTRKELDAQATISPKR